MPNSFLSTLSHQSIMVKISDFRLYVKAPFHRGRIVHQLKCFKFTVPRTVRFLIFARGHWARFQTFRTTSKNALLCDLGFLLTLFVIVNLLSTISCYLFRLKPDISQRWTTRSDSETSFQFDILCITGLQRIFWTENDNVLFRIYAWYLIQNTIFKFLH